MARGVCVVAVCAAMGCASMRAQVPAAPEHAAQCPPPVVAPTVDPVLALIDGQPVLRSELLRRSVAYGLTRAAIADPDERTRHALQLEWIALDAWINDAVAAAEATRRGMPDDPAMVDLALQQIARDRRMTPAQIVEQVTAAGVTEQAYREELGAQFRIVRMSSQYIVPRVQVRDEEVQAVWEHMPEPRPVLEQAREEIRTGIRQRRAECETRTWLETLRREHGVQVLLARPADLPALSAGPAHGVVLREAVMFTGNVHVPTHDLQGALPTGPRIALDDDGRLPETVRDAMTTLYHARGYADVRVDNAPEAVDACDPRVAHEVVDIHEGAHTSAH